MNKQPEKTKATKTKIIEAFWILFQKQPLEKITIRDLSSAAGIHRSSFYRYFPDIYYVFDEFQKDLLEKLDREIVEIQSNADIGSLNYAKKIADLLVRSADKIYQMLNYANCDFGQKFCEILKPNIVKRIPSDFKTPHGEYVTALILSGIIFNFRFWYEHREQYDLMRLINLGQGIIMRGLNLKAS